MMLLGTAYIKPYESWYARSRRILALNNILVIEFSKLEFFALEVGVKSPLFFNENPDYQNLLQTGIEIENHIANSQKYSFLNDINNYDSYKPILRNCSKCSQEGYHHEIFDYEWLKKCPVHNTELSYSCPSCKKGWPTIPQILLRKCKGCGINNDAYRSIRNTQDDLEKYDFLEVLSDVVFKFEETAFFIKSVSEEKVKNNFMFFNGNEIIHSDLFLSFASSIGIVNSSQKQQISKHLTIFESNSIDEIMHKSIVSKKCTTESSSAFSMMIKIFTKTLKITLGGDMDSNHELGGCNECEQCKTWRYWQNISNDRYKVIFGSEKRFLKNELNSFYFQPISVIESLIRTQNAALSKKTYHFFFSLPTEVQHFLIEIDLWCLVENYGSLIRGKNQSKTQVNNSISNDFIPQNDKFIEHTNMSINVFENKHGNKMFYPESLEDINLFRKSFSFYKEALSQHIEFKEKFYDYLCKKLSCHGVQPFSGRVVQFGLLWDYKNEFIHKHYHKYKRRQFFNDLFYGQHERSFKQVPYQYFESEIYSVTKRAVTGHSSFNFNYFLDR